MEGEIYFFCFNGRVEVLVAVLQKTNEIAFFKVQLKFVLLQFSEVH